MHEPYDPDLRTHEVRLPALNGDAKPKRKRSKVNGSAGSLVTEDSAALAFTALYRGHLRYCHDIGAWFEWTGTRWRKNATGLAYHWARELARRLAAASTEKVQAIAARSGFA